MIIHCAEVMQQVFSHWQNIADHAIEAKGRLCIGLSGGKTPAGLYQYLAQHSDPAIWPLTDIFLVDERLVDDSHPYSNYRMIKENLVDVVGFKPNLHGISCADVTVKQAAMDYQKKLQGFFKNQKGVPVFDLIVLGVGQDGHTASLFPQDPAIDERLLWIAPVSTPYGGYSRITMTLPVLNAARNIFFLVLGAQKASIAAQIWKDGVSLPAGKINPVDGKKFVFLDEQAASLF